MSLGPVIVASRQVLKQPLKFASRVVAGFGRGDRLLGWPTANLEETHELVASLQDIEAGA